MRDTLLSAQSEIRFDGRRILEILRRRPLMIATMTMVAPIVAFLYISRQAPIYQAQASVVIDSATPQPLGPTFRDVVDVENNWWSAQEYLTTQFKIIQSRRTALDTARALCKKKLPDGHSVAEFMSGDPGCTDATVERVAAMIMGRLEVAPVKESRLVNLIVKDTNAQLAAAIANAYAETYEAKNLERRLEKSDDASGWLKAEYSDIASQVRAAEEALIKFKRDHNILSLALDDQQNELSQRRHKIVDELSTVQLRLITLNSQREQVKGLGNSDPLKETAPQLQDNPVIQRMKETYAAEYQRLVELQGKYLDKHPAVLAQRERLDAIRADIVNEARLSLKALDISYNAKAREEKDLETELERATRESLQLESRSTEYNKLKRDFERLQKLSDQVGGREKESSLAAKLHTNNVYVLDHALIPSGALRPNPLLAGSIAMVAGFFLGFALAFLLDMLDSTVKTQEDIEERLGLPFLGVIPRIAPANEKEEAAMGPVELYIHKKPKSPVAECCRAIRTSLVFMSPDKPLRKILVTSGEPQEGKSTTAASLAITLAQSGQRVLLVDTDMRRPRVHKIFGLKPKSKNDPVLGFSSLVAGEASIDEVVRDTEVKNLFVLQCGPIPPTPSELLHSERCKQVVKELGERFDRVVFDSPPLGVVTDAAILSQLCDGTILVAKSAKTPREFLSRARKLLTDLKVNILGCVLNDLDLTARSGYGYRYYHYRYGRYYSDEQPSTATSGHA